MEEDDGYESAEEYYSEYPEYDEGDEEL